MEKSFLSFLSFVVKTTVAMTLTLFTLAAEAHHLYTAVNMMKSEVILINVDTDEIIITKLSDLPGWPAAAPVLQHSWITPDESQLLISTDANPPGDASIVVLDIENIDWKNRVLKLKMDKFVQLAPSGTPSQYPEVSEVDPAYPIPAWTKPPYTQSHGPTFLPDTPYTYITHLGDNRIRVFNYKTGELAPVDPMAFGDASRQMHGINFNASGKIGLGAGYFFDNNQIDIYKPKKKTGEVTLKASVTLGTYEEYAAFTHFTYWMDDRYAVVGTMQLGPTSLTDDDAKIIGPSVWLLDTKKAAATKILGSAASADDAGVYRSASDVAVANGKLYVAEEDSIAEVFGRDGFVAIYDMSDKFNPKFIKRLKPGVGLPSDFVLGHALAVTPDDRFVYVSSYVSNHIIKIDTATDKVVKVYTSADGLDMPHGEFISGRLR